MPMGGAGAAGEEPIAQLLDCRHLTGQEKPSRASLVPGGERFENRGPVVPRIARDRIDENIAAKAFAQVRLHPRQIRGDVRVWFAVGRRRSLQSKPPDV